MKQRGAYGGATARCEWCWKQLTRGKKNKRCDAKCGEQLRMLRYWLRRRDKAREGNRPPVCNVCGKSLGFRGFSRYTRTCKNYECIIKSAAHEEIGP